MSSTNEQQQVESLCDALRHVESWTQSVEEIGEIAVVELRPHHEPGVTAIFLSLHGTTHYNRLLIKTKHRKLFELLRALKKAGII